MAARKRIAKIRVGREGGVDDLGGYFLHCALTTHWGGGRELKKGSDETGLYREEGIEEKKVRVVGLGHGMEK